MNRSIVVLRFFAILSVVIGHSIIVFSGNWNYFHVLSSSLLLKVIKSFIDFYQMPVFIFISGYLLSYTGKISHMNGWEDEKQFLITKAKRLLLPFVMVAFCWIMPIRTLINFENINQYSIINRFFNNFILNKLSGNLWYLPTLFLIFVIFIVLIDKCDLEKWGGIILVVSIFSGLFPSAFYLSKVAYYFLFFWIGYYFEKNQGKILSNMTKMRIIMCYIIVIFFALFNIHNIIINILCGILSIFMFFYTAERLSRLASTKFVKLVDKNSYGIYLFHSTLIYPILYCVNGKDINPYLLSIFLFIICLSVSLIVTMVLRKLKATAFIIGE